MPSLLGSGRLSTAARRRCSFEVMVCCLSVVPSFCRENLELIHNAGRDPHLTSQDTPKRAPERGGEGSRLGTMATLNLTHLLYSIKRNSTAGFFVAGGGDASGQCVLPGTNAAIPSLRPSPTGDRLHYPRRRRRGRWSWSGSGACRSIPWGLRGAVVSGGDPQMALRVSVANLTRTVCTLFVMCVCVAYTDVLL